MAQRVDKKQQKELLVEVMEADEKDGLYEQSKQQTAVEWFYDRLKHVNKDVYNEMSGQFEEAKRKENQQREKVREEGFNFAYTKFASKGIQIDRSPEWP